MKTLTPSSRPASPSRYKAAPLSGGCAGPEGSRPRADSDASGLLRASRKVPLVMGVLNVTPDSFYPESRFQDREAAVSRALTMREQGADFIDIGGQSTRPGSDPVSEDEEIRRVIPVLEALAGRLDVPISIDTDKAEVARLALEAGAAIINDVSALRADSRMAGIAVRAQAVILMHRGGNSPKTMQDAPRYGDVVAEVRAFLAERLRAFEAAGGDPRKVWLDPGIGFGKDLDHNLSLLKHLEFFVALERPVLVGVSRKSFLERIEGAPLPPSERLEGSLAVACWAALQGVKVLRVHDVKETRRALAVLETVIAAR